MQIVTKKISVTELEKMSKKMFGNLVKAVVDIEKKLMAVDADMHADEEQILLEEGSKQEHLWGINLYPEQHGTDEWIEFDSMINIRPVQGNRSRGIDNPEIRNQIINIVNLFVSK
jgi:hypothetical protein